jgi:MFS family permease
VVANQKNSDLSADQHVPRNFLLQLLAQGLTKLGDALVDVKTILPWVMQSLEVPILLISALIPLRESGSLLPQLWWTAFVKRQRQRKRVWIYGCIGQALAIFSMSVIVAFLNGLLAGTLLLLVLSGFSLARSLCSIASKDVIGRTIPKTRRGKLSGWSASVAGLLTLLVGLLLWRNNENGRDVHVLILLVASFLWIVAAAVYQLIFEPAEESSDDSANTTSTALLWRDRNFRNFILVRTLLLSSALITPFYTILIQESSSQRSQLGLLVMASSLAAIASGPIWGKLADWSSRWVLIIAGIIVAINGLLSVTINHNLETSFNLWLTLAFFFQIFAYQGVRLGRKIYLVDMAEGDQRTDYVALGNSLIGVMLLVCSLFGVVAQFFSVAAVITLLSMMSLVAALLALRLPEVEVLTDE